MKTSFAFAKVAGSLALMAASSVAMASVVNTAHNLGSTNTSGGNFNSGTTEICIFCHTPHGGDQNTFAPIWNRATATGVTYTRFSSLNRLTFDAKEAPIGSVSAACLSCHDGTQAMDAVINSPGSNTTGTVGANLWSEASVTGHMSDLAAADGHWYGGATRGDMIFLGTDLRNDHPISMQYGGGGLSSTTLTAQTNDPDFAQAVGALDMNGNAVAAGSGHGGGLVANGGTGYTSHAGQGNTTSVNNNIAGGTNLALIVGVNGSGTGVIQHELTSGVGGGDRWWVETTGDTTFSSQDFPLYTRAGTDADGGVTGSAAIQPTVECGTCHDPHSGNSTFLRLVGSNNGSAVCLTCHAK